MMEKYSLKELMFFISVIGMFLFLNNFILDNKNISLFFQIMLLILVIFLTIYLINMSNKN